MSTESPDPFEIDEPADTEPVELDVLATAAVATEIEALPEAPPHEPPRPLTPGAFLRGEFEIKSLLVRGFTNIYAANGGDYGEVSPKLIVERELAAGEAPVAEMPDSALFPSGEVFAQDDRAYFVCDFFESTSLQDYREPMNDERLLGVLSTLAHGLAALETAGLSVELSNDQLRLDGAGKLVFLGLPAPLSENNAPLPQLRAVTDFLLKHVFAESSTMRLDDRFAGLALSEEVKALARRIDEDADEPYATAQAIAEAIDSLYIPGRPLSIDAALLSDVGQERELNEDAGTIVRTWRAAHLGSRQVDLYVVSDGMGGHEGGEVASDLTLTSLTRRMSALDIDFGDNIAVRAALVETIDAVNAEVVALTEAPQYRGTRAKPGATLTFALCLGARAFIGNVGDSRTYLFNHRGLQRVTKDHSYVQSLIDRGELTEDEAWDHPEGSIITAHIGYPKLKTRDVFLRLMSPGDTLLLVSDGVVDMLRDREIEAIMDDAATGGKSSVEVCRALVDAANGAGGFDNITALAVSFK